MSVNAGDLQEAVGKPEGEVIALTGGANFLGEGVLKQLVEDPRAARLVAIGSNQPAIEHPKLVFHKVDLTNPTSNQVLAHIFTREKVTAFLHLIITYALSRNRALAHEMEAIGTMHLLDACSASGVKRIVARSTTAIYGARPGNPNFLTESHPTAEHGPDSIVSDKAELERQMRQYADQHPECGVAILRESASLGPSSINYLSRILLSLYSPRVLGFDPLMQFIHEDDLFRAYSQVLFGEAEGIFNVVGKGVVRYSEAIRLAGGAELSLPESILRSAASLLWALKLYDIPASYLDFLKYSWVADGSKAANSLGFFPDYDCFRALEDLRRVRRSGVA